MSAHRAVRKTNSPRVPRTGWLRLFIVALCLVLSAPFPVSAKLSKEARYAIIRGLLRETGVNKVPLPRGGQGVQISAEGKLNEEGARGQVREHGLAVPGGMPVSITKINFGAKRILFEINGGPRRGRRWYERIQIGGSAGVARPIGEPPVLTYGSKIYVVFPQEIPELTVEQIKRLLGAAVDFERHSPTPLYSPSVPANIKEAIKNKQVIKGMNHDAVLASKGPPERKVREVKEGVEMEEWIYGLPPHVLVVTFDGDEVVSTLQY